MPSPTARFQSLTPPIRRGILGYVCYGIGMLLTRLLTRFQTRNPERIPSAGNFVLVANHETYVDGLWLAALLSRSQFARFCALVGADLLTDHGLFGRIICRVGQGIPVNRRENPIRGLILAKKHVDAGRILLVHPEGTRTHDGRLGPLQNGAAYIAAKSGVPLVPVYIDGGYQIFNRHWKWPHPFIPGTLRRKPLILTVGEPLLPADYEDVHAMTEALTRWFQEQQDCRTQTDPPCPGPAQAEKG